MAANERSSRSSDVSIRDARADERVAIRDLTVRAYAEYATIMTPAAWAGLEGAMIAALASNDRVERIVAERDCMLVGSVMLYPAAADAYGGAVERANCPEVRLLSVAPEARGLGVGRALMAECMRRARHAGARELGVHT